MKHKNPDSKTPEKCFIIGAFEHYNTCVSLSHDANETLFLFAQKNTYFFGEFPYFFGELSNYHNRIVIFHANNFKVSFSLNMFL